VLEEGRLSPPLTDAPLATPYALGISKKLPGPKRICLVRRKYGWNKGPKFRPQIPVEASRRADADRGVGKPKSYVFDEQSLPFDQFLACKQNHA